MNTKFLRVYLSIIAAGLLAGASTAALAVDAPKRKPGLWEISMTMVESGGKTTPLPGPSQHCIDAKTDDMMQQQSREMSKDKCSAVSHRRESANRFSFEGTCKTGDTTTVSKGVFTGDFSSNYRGEITSTFDPPMMGMKESKMTLAAKWTGPCKPGMKPGDVIMPNMPGMPAGMQMPKINMQDLMKNR